MVLGEFLLAGYLIHDSFYNWKQSPISTTIEILSKSDIKFPNVTVCPPKNLFLNLNHDIKQSKNVKLTNDSRKELFDFAMDVIQDECYTDIIANLSKLTDSDRYFNWYHGYSNIELPNDQGSSTFRSRTVYLGRKETYCPLTSIIYYIHH